MSFHAYANYRLIDMGWIKEVPSHWAVHPLKRVVSVGSTKRDVIPSDNYVGLENVSSWQGVITGGEAEATAEGLGIEFREGDILFGKLRPYLAKVALARASGIASTEFIVLRGTQVDPRFLRYSMVAREFIDAVNATTYGAKMPRANWEDIGLLPQAVPPISEQKTIAEFLDRETAKIDALISKQEELEFGIDRKRRALISDAVTGRLQPVGARIDSGVEWIGTIPSNWKLLRFGKIARLQGGYAFKSEDFTSDGVPVVRMNNLRRGMLDLSAAACVPPDLSISQFSLDVGDILVGMSGSLGETGSLGNYAVVGELDIPSQLNQRVGRFRGASNELFYPYIKCLIRSDVFAIPIVTASTGSAQFNISAEQIHSILVPFPPKQEQVEICKRVDFEMQNLLQMETSLINMRKMLVERRSALITAAVTGRIEIGAKIAAEAAE